ncbi:MAG TPA: DUF5985 family protein [Thermoanaerobaculia bacterium]|nr:DUF5985 family protein [Thermoanaerobaculia bacterium]
MIVHFISGMLVMGYLVAAVFFFKFWRDSADRLFGIFAVAFLLLAVQRTLTSLFVAAAAIFIIRLIAFLLIVVAIVDKNRARRSAHSSPSS